MYGRVGDCKRDNRAIDGLHIRSGGLRESSESAFGLGATATAKTEYTSSGAKPGNTATRTAETNATEATRPDIPAQRGPVECRVGGIAYYARIIALWIGKPMTIKANEERSVQITTGQLISIVTAAFGMLAVLVPAYLNLRDELVRQQMKWTAQDQRNAKQDAINEKFLERTEDLSFVAKWARGEISSPKGPSK